MSDYHSTTELQVKLSLETDEEKKNELRVKYLIRYLQNYEEYPNKETFIGDVLYALGVSVDQSQYSDYEGCQNFKIYLRDKFLNV